MTTSFRIRIKNLRYKIVCRMVNIFDIMTSVIQGRVLQVVAVVLGISFYH